MNTFWREARHPVPEVGLVDTSLRYTDILFGFVIKELFMRLQHWFAIPVEVRGQLLVGAVLVLGSWIGFRRSLNRSSYEVKFFNLPLLRFVADQLMLILYLRMATLTAEFKPEAREFPVPPDLLQDTLLLVYSVFILYLIWDLFGCWMAVAKIPPEGSLPARPRYPKVEDKKMTDRPAEADVTGLTMTFLGLFSFALLYQNRAAFPEIAVYSGLVLLLLLYRFLKELRKSESLLLFCRFLKKFWKSISFAKS
ncbi:MAG TPA: hypothetical protein VGO11_23805 [Chthoniobacteraceae bacterium]|nr:hypothetical protein [Chthoniobacteraceae bacterium]